MQNIRKNVIFTGIGYILPLLAALLTIPVMTSKLGVELYGLYVICYSLIGFMTLVDLGIGQTIVKYVAEYEATGQCYKVKPVLDVSFLIYLILGGVSVLLLYSCAPQLAASLYNQPAKQMIAEHALRITALPLLFSYINQFFLNVCKAYHRFDMPAVIHNSGNLAGIVLATIILLLGYSLIEVMWGYVLVQALTLAAGFRACSLVLPAGIKPIPAFKKSIFTEIITFSAYTFISNFVGSLALRADKLMIGIIIGTDAVTYYQIPFTIAQMANGIIHTLVHITFPRFSEMFSTDDKEGILTLYKLTNDIVFIISMLIAVLLIAVGSDFLAIWISPDFSHKATLPLFILSVYFFLHSNTVVGYWVLQGGGQAKLTAFMSVINTIAYFIALYYFASHYSYIGASLALFLLLITIPLQYIWIAEYVGHSYKDYLMQLLAFLLIGYALVYVLAHINRWLGHSVVEIMINSLVVLVLLIVSMKAILSKQGLNVFKAKPKIYAKTHYRRQSH